MAWISVSERLPEPGVEVYVAGKYARKPPFPKARLETRPDVARYFGRWSSREWRGMVAIWHWWEDTPDAPNDNQPDGA